MKKRTHDRLASCFWWHFENWCILHNYDSHLVRGIGQKEKRTLGFESHHSPLFPFLISQWSGTTLMTLRPSSRTRPTSVGSSTTASHATVCFIHKHTRVFFFWEGGFCSHLPFPRLENTETNFLPQVHANN